ncbi:MAG TPA: hypothetical protein ENH88_02240 [Pseudoalteromonas prydzensis]|uniref:Uncharacterized protein n=3 Tax=root TaxID=1 RepID=A0A7V1GDI0_9GAMM|nr:hypothetical protein [Pseudoalteromonas prydzensis]
MLRYMKIARWHANKQLRKQQQNLQPHKLRFYEQGKAIWFNLNTAQKLYLLALLCLIIFQSGWLCAAITIVALTIEFWPKFNKLWHSLAGKALILIFYASIANFVLADASGIVNNVTHVSATHFNYTHNFATLLYLPPWALGISLSTLLLLQLILPFYIFALLIIKPFGSQRVKFISQSYSPLLTASIRFFLSTIVIINLMSFVDDKDTDAVIDDIVSNFVSSKALSSQSLTEQQEVEVVEELSQKIHGQLPSEDITETPPAPPITNMEEDETTQSVRLFFNTKGYFERSKRLIAMFAYTYEADQYSRCKKSDDSKAIEINDYEIVEIAPDNSKPYGYSFTVKACQSPGIKAP